MKRGVPASLEVDKETFEKVQTTSIQKAINQHEVPAKEKHVRNAILGTYQEKSAYTFWHVVRRLQLSTHAITCWKFCHVLHKLLRDGHESTLSYSIKYKQQVKDLGKIWSHAVQAYGTIISKYSKCLVQRMEFQVKFSEFPGNFSISDDTLEKIGNNDINTFFELCVDILDCLDSQMDLQEAIFRTLDFSKAISMTAAGQCRLAPCIPIILDSSQMYDYSVKLLFKLHACLPQDTLIGHRDRFTDLYGKLKKFYYQCSNMQYFKRLIQIPIMPESPPDFLLKLERSHQLGPVRMLNEAPPTEIDRSPSPEPEPEPAPAPLIETNFDEVFGGSMGDFSFHQEPDPRDELIRQLREEIESLKAQIVHMTAEHEEEIKQLLDRISELEKELMAKETHAKADQVRMQELQKRLEEADEQAENAVLKQSMLVDVEKKASANEDLYKKMKEKYMSLVKDHALLMRKNADAQKQSENLQQSAEDHESKKTQLLRESERLQQSLQDKERNLQEAEQRNKEDAHLLFVSAVEATESMICQAVTAMEDPVNSQSTCSAEALIKTVESAIEAVEKLEVGAKEFVHNQTQNKVVQALSTFGHTVSQTLLNGMATCHLVSDSHGKELGAACHSCGSESLAYLSKLKNYQMYENKDEVISTNEMDDELQKILSTAKELLPKMTDIVGGDLQDMVDQEMSSTSHAIESAAARIEEMLREARERDTGVNLEVNERILDSCTELMQAIRALIISSKELQREIVNEGRGASSVKEFYMKNSRWTEGLISAAKAVGFGATLLTDSADQAVKGEGKFEEIIVCSHEIAASTAQLVAASRVKANKTSPKLPKLQKCSKDVNAAAGRVVASTNAGRKQIDDTGDDLSNDLSKFTLTQIKRKEMDSQVRILELEQALQDERLTIGKLRKQHYILAAENEEKDEQQDEANNNNNNGETQQKNGNETPPSQNGQPKLKPPLPAKPVGLQNP
uniref:huntingtin-interacting protein 1-like n=1 Tax=Styela clava TaxID=7725 RepID=UPI00193936B1|nr:huntingtin-interacting protein 1-like [Styela clava]